MRKVKEQRDIRLEDGRVGVLSCVELPDGSYETMLYTDDTRMDEVFVENSRTEDAALMAFKYALERYQVPELTGKYKKLAEDLCKAIAFGAAHAGTDDGGTCNFDSPAVALPRWNEKLVNAAAKAAGTSCFKWKCYGATRYVFSIPGVGQGYTRTKSAESAAQLLQSLGYDAHVYYQMD